jgi:hypothetical protein
VVVVVPAACAPEPTPTKAHAIVAAKALPANTLETVR